jgi:hypothetical protein
MRVCRFEWRGASIRRRALVASPCLCGCKPQGLRKPPGTRVSSCAVLCCFCTRGGVSEQPVPLVHKLPCLPACLPACHAPLYTLCADTCSNSIRVVKTTKQTATVPLTYPAAIKVGCGGASSMCVSGLGGCLV